VTDRTAVARRTDHRVGADADRHSLRERLEPLGAAWRPLTATGIVLVAVLSVTGLVLTRALDGSRVVHWDVDVETWLVDHRTSALDVVAEGGTWFSETFVVPVVLLIAVLIAWRVSARLAAPVLLHVAVGGEKLIYLV